MRISFREHILELQSWPDKHEMQSALAACNAGSLLLGESSEQEREFYSVTVFLGYAGLRTLGVGICSEGHGITPGLLLQPTRSTLVFGFNSQVAGVNIADENIAFTVTLDSLFYHFLPLPEQDKFLVVHEIGAVALSSVGRILWKFNQDIVTDAVIRENRLYLDFMDSPSVCLDLGDGEECRPV